MSLPYIKHNNIFFVPIIRARLNFAVLVQRAVAEFKHKGEDFIFAVELPASIDGKIREAIKKLPQVSLLVSKVGQGHNGAIEDREVFPITPCDGIIEAVRIAVDEGIPLHYIDIEINPAHLLDRYCMIFPDWPDDNLILKYGAKWYLDLIQKDISHPSARIDPIDTRREIFMADQLRLLHTKYQRSNILFVCDVAHVAPIRKLLKEPKLITEDKEQVRTPLKLEILKPNLNILLYYLDDMPKLVEIYERYRDKNTCYTISNDTIAKLRTKKISGNIMKVLERIKNIKFAGKENLLDSLHKEIGRIITSSEKVLIIQHIQKTSNAKDFNKRKALLEVIQKINEKNDYQKKFSAYNFIEFASLLNKLTINARMGTDKGVSPKLEHVLQAAATSFNKRFSAIIHRHLLEFFNQIDIDSINKSLSANIKEDTFQYKPRFCIPEQLPEQLMVMPPPPALSPSPPPSKDLCNALWPPYKRFLKRMRQKAHNLTEYIDRHLVSAEYRGSLEYGIDLRTTLKDHMSMAFNPCIKPKLYVKRQRLSRINYMNIFEPVVWIIDPRSKVKVKSNYTWFGYGGGPRYIAELIYHLPRALVDERDKEQVKIYFYERVGFISFCETGTPLRNIQREYGAEFEQRVPKSEDFEEIEGIGPVLSSLINYVYKNPWWDILLVVALKYAKYSVSCVLPTEFSIPAKTVALAKAQGKTFHQIPLSNFSPDEQQKLAKYYTINWQQSVPQDKDVNDDDYMTFIENCFKGIMRPFTN
ncbi:MAG: hypothetical protein ACMUIU_11535 [bacterium]